MTLPKNKKIEHDQIESMKIAVDQYDIRAIHPEKVVESAEYLVQQARTKE